MTENCDLLLDYFNHQLTEEEAKAFEKHLETCPECQEELNMLRELTEDLPYSSEPVTPPREMKARVLGNILAGTDETTKSDETINQQVMKTSDTYKENVSVADKREYNRPARMPKKKETSWFKPLMVAVLILSLIGNAIALISTTSDEASPDKQEDSLNSIQELIVLNPSESIDAKATAAIVDQGEDLNLIIQTEDLPALEGKETYQVWVIEGEKPSRAGTFVLNENGEGAVSFLLDHEHQWDTIAITKEPDAYSQTPEGDILLSASL